MDSVVFKPEKTLDKLILESLYSCLPVTYEAQVAPVKPWFSLSTPMDQGFIISQPFP